MNYNTIKNIIRQELRRINEANENSSADLEKAADAIDEINKLIHDFKPKFDKAIGDLERNLPLDLQDYLPDTDGLLSEGDFWDSLTRDIDTISSEIEDLLAQEEKGGDPKKIAAEIRRLGLVDEYLSLPAVPEAALEDFYRNELGMKLPSELVDGDVYDTLNKERERGFSSERGS